MRIEEIIRIPANIPKSFIYNFFIDALFMLNELKKVSRTFQGKKG